MMKTARKTARTNQRRSRLDSVQEPILLRVINTQLSLFLNEHRLDYRSSFFRQDALRDDARQDAIVAVLERLDSFDPRRSQFQTFASGIVRNSIAQTMASARSIGFRK